MKWEETIASKCRYGDTIGEVFKNADIIWENSEYDYQGFANILAAMPNGTFVHYEWTYGSCSGCDEWESRELSDDQIINEVKNNMAVLHNKKELMKYVHLDKKFIKNMKYPIANSPTNGSIPGMLRMFSDDRVNGFKEMAIAVEKYLSRKV